MDAPALRVLGVAIDAALASALAARGWAVETAAEPASAPGPARTPMPADDRWQAADAVLVAVPDGAALAAWADEPALPAAALDTAWVFAAAPGDAALEERLLQRGAEAIVEPGDAAALARALRHAVARKRLERAARTAYATDIATGLPHQAQLLEHLTQLLALREREPAPMVLIVLRVEGFARAAALLGAEAGNVLRRKVAVRLRGGLRASDVVAAIGPDAFGVLLGRLESIDDGERVAAKLVRALQQPIAVAGQPFRVGAAVGLARYPEHGKDAMSLLQRAGAQAGSVAVLGREGHASAAFGGTAAAANDAAGDDPPR